MHHFKCSTDLQNAGCVRIAKFLKAVHETRNDDVHSQEAVTQDYDQSFVLHYTQMSGKKFGSIQFYMHLIKIISDLLSGQLQ